ncbi:T9SS type A sorting domain-containing protein [uncultured Winogradskyella sp.]|uniref:T9SS type A sorting domain-containing protein n=1 Tax=uncultured Winogradskyella sp. TaxID=395353 RepID=UPI00263452E5|nr:T9SS type A sorting domain-containing protein [uncultured Winogradskyella sp.]
MKFKLLYLLTFITLVSFGQKIPDAIKPPSWSNNSLNALKPYKLANFDLKKIQEEDKINDKDKSKPWRFGHDIYVDHNINDVGEWTTLANGDRLWRMTYKSEGAYTLNFMFDVFKIPEGAQLYVYNNEKTDLLRPFTHHNNNPEEILGTWMVNGDQAWIEYYQPANVVGTAKITVGSVIHGYRTAETYQKGLNDSGACNQDVDCDITPSNDLFQLNLRKEEVKKAAGMITVNGGTGICSGTLINNTSNDGTPYFMTANHCGGGEAGWAFRFNWRSPNPSCSTTANSTNGSFNQTVSGSIVRAASSRSDMELVEITDINFFNNNPDVVWSGWNRSTTQVPVVNFGIHHPRGDIQKTCREDDGAYRQVVSFNGDANTQMWYIDEWELGVTEPGSSGSGLFNESGHLIGVLSGGAAACSGTSNNAAFDYYGRFGVAWDFGGTPSTRLREWLDPTDTGLEVAEIYPTVQIFDNDATINAGSGLNAELCGSDFSPEVTLINRGNLDLTSAEISYSLDSEADITVSWTGNLASNASEIVATPTYNNLEPGPHVFNVSVNLPNGIADENNTNDNFSFNFDVSPNVLTSNVIFNITTDNFASETTWQITNSNNTVIESGPTGSYFNNTTYQETIAIPTFGDCYTFTIFDSYADGICCGFGNGSYDLQDDNGNVIISGGDFGGSESVLFRVQDPLSINEFELNELINLFPNPVTNQLNIDLGNINEDATYQMFNTIGQLVGNGKLNSNSTTTINMSQQESGIYFIQINTKSNSITKKVVRK